MAVDFDEFPIYDALVKPNSQQMSNVWMNFMATFHQTLINYLTQNGIFLSVLTTEQRDSLQSPQEGQMIYNIDAIPGPPRTAQVQIWQVIAGVAGWRVFTTT